MNGASTKIKSAIVNFEQYRGRKPEHIIIESFLYEQLKYEMNERKEFEVTGDIKTVFGIPVILLRNSLVIS